MATTYTLKIVLDAAEIQDLKEGKYSLCIAKKVNNKYNVVWHGTSFLENNEFQWTEQYGVFGQAGFTSGTLVNTLTNTVPIQFGQTSKLDTNGVMQAATGPIQGGSFNVRNDFGTINIGVQSVLNGTWAPIYVDPLPTAEWMETLTPVESILVWFDRSLTTSTIFSTAVSRSLEVNFTGITSQTVSYVSGAKPGTGIWITGSPTTGLQFVPGKIYHPVSNTFEDLPFANNHAVTQGLLDKFLSSPLGKSMSPATHFLAEAVITFSPSADVHEAMAFIKAYIPPVIKASFETRGNTLVVKLGWAAFVSMKALDRERGDINKLEELLKSTLSLYAPGYLSVTLTERRNGAIEAIPPPPPPPTPPKELTLAAPNLNSRISFYPSTYSSSMDADSVIY